MPWYGMIFALGGALLLLCCGGLLLIRTLLIVITVQGQSMSPALEHGDRVLAMRPVWPCRVRKGQIVLFNQSLADEVIGDPALSLHIKRVVALGGETYVSSTPHHGYDEHVPQKDHAYLWHIPQDHLFVCGDNREQSIDSRSWGPLPLRNVRGIMVKKLSPAPVSLSARVATTQRSASPHEGNLYESSRQL